MKGLGLQMACLTVTDTTPYAPAATWNLITISHRLTACIDFNALLDAPILVHSVKRGKVIVRLISTCALDKVGPSICVFSASIGGIMHDTGLIVFSRITVRAVPIVVVEMDGMPMFC